MKVEGRRISVETRQRKRRRFLRISFFFKFQSTFRAFSGSHKRKMYRVAMPALCTQMKGQCVAAMVKPPGHGRSFVADAAGTNRKPNHISDNGLLSWTKAGSSIVPLTCPGRFCSSGRRAPSRTSRTSAKFPQTLFPYADLEGFHFTSFQISFPVFRFVKFTVKFFPLENFFFRGQAKAEPRATAVRSTSFSFT